MHRVFSNSKFLVYLSSPSTEGKVTKFNNVVKIRGQHTIAVILQLPAVNKCIVSMSRTEHIDSKRKGILIRRRSNLSTNLIGPPCVSD